MVSGCRVSRGGFLFFCATGLMLAWLETGCFAMDITLSNCLKKGEIWPFKGSSNLIVLFDSENDGCHDYRSGLTWGPWFVGDHSKYRLDEATKTCQKLGRRLPTLEEFHNLRKLPPGSEGREKELTEYIRRHLPFASTPAFFFADKPRDTDRSEFFYAFLFLTEEEVRLSRRTDAGFLASFVCVHRPPDDDSDGVPNESDRCTRPLTSGAYFLDSSFPVKVYTFGEFFDVKSQRRINYRGCAPQQLSDEQLLVQEQREKEIRLAEARANVERERQKISESRAQAATASSGQSRYPLGNYNDPLPRPANSFTREEIGMRVFGYMNTGWQDTMERLYGPDWYLKDPRSRQKFYSSFNR